MTEYVYIRKEYFEQHPDYVKMLDEGNPDKQSHRTHIFINFEYNENNFYIPLRNNLGEPIRPFGKIGYPVPSLSRPNAGLDYRHMIIVNDEKYIEYPKELHIPRSQSRVIDDNYKTIKKEASEYISGFIRAAKKNRIQSEPKYRESSLINFVSELNV